MVPPTGGLPSEPGEPGLGPPSSDTGEGCAQWVSWTLWGKGGGGAAQWVRSFAGSGMSSFIREKACPFHGKCGSS